MASHTGVIGLLSLLSAKATEQGEQFPSILSAHLLIFWFHSSFADCRGVPPDLFVRPSPNSSPVALHSPAPLGAFASLLGAGTAPQEVVGLEVPGAHRGWPGHYAKRASPGANN